MVAYDRPPYMALLCLQIQEISAFFKYQFLLLTIYIENSNRFTDEVAVTEPPHLDLCYLQIQGFFPFFLRALNITPVSRSNPPIPCLYLLLLV